MKQPQTTLQEIVRDYGSMIRRIALSYESVPDLADELAQEIYLAIWRALPSFRGDAGIRTFLARIATNRAVTHVARAMKAPPSSELNEEVRSTIATPEYVAIANDRRAALMAAVQQLPLTYRQPVTLVLEGLSLDEVAQVLGITPNAAAIRMTRAKHLLKDLMGRKTL